MSKHSFPIRQADHLFTVTLALLLDVALAGGLVLGSYVYNYKMPHKMQPVLTFQENAPLLNQESGTPKVATPIQQASMGLSTAIIPTVSWAEKFGDHFSDTIVSTDTSYKSPSVSVELTQVSYDSGKLDYSSNGKHKKYGSKIAYTLADIYISDISCLQTGFAKDSYGIGFSELLPSMSKRMQSVLAVNGDSYSNNHHQNNGTIIRNGTVYRAQASTEETCVLFRDGTMKIYSPEQLDAQQLVRDGAWQSWVFGPSLLDANGKATTNFNTWDYIREGHPRTAIGYYEPGHYCLLIVDGRTKDYSRGMTLEEMSQLFASLGCKAAYNLDGGHSSSMTLETTVVTRPYNKNKEVSDGIFIFNAA
ncbi:MAG: phosphodiester glycosidase family protein [Pygmaiobacter sp.]|nr:phosphodiester glycosidase family protein [Pygmaiobacter sp.]